MLIHLVLHETCVFDVSRNIKILKIGVDLLRTLFSTNFIYNYLMQESFSGNGRIITESLPVLGLEAVCSSYSSVTELGGALSHSMCIPLLEDPNIYDFGWPPGDPDVTLSFIPHSDLGLWPPACRVGLMAFLSLLGAWHLPDLVGIQGWRLAGLEPAWTLEATEPLPGHGGGQWPLPSGVGCSPGSESVCGWRLPSCQCPACLP